MAVNSRKSRKKTKAVKKVKKLFRQITSPHWLRQNRKQLLAIIAAFLIFVWVAGPAVFRLLASAPKEARGAGELFGKLVPRGEFSSANHRWYALMSLMSQQPPSPDQMHQLTWEYLAYIHEAKQLGLFVSDEEVASQIVEMFGGKGKFDPSVYLRVLNERNISESAFEQAVRDWLLVLKLQRRIRSNVHLTSEEAWQRYAFENEKVKIRYAEFKDDDFKDFVTVTDKDVEKFYEKYKDTPEPENGQGIGYKRPPQVKLEYVMVRVNDLAPKMKIPEERLRKYYEENKERYRKPKATVPKPVAPPANKPTEPTKKTAKPEGKSSKPGATQNKAQSSSTGTASPKKATPANSVPAKTKDEREKNKKKQSLLDLRKVLEIAKLNDGPLLTASAPTEKVTTKSSKKGTGGAAPEPAAKTSPTTPKRKTAVETESSAEKAKSNSAKGKAEGTKKSEAKKEVAKKNGAEYKPFEEVRDSILKILQRQEAKKEAKSLIYKIASEADRQEKPDLAALAKKYDVIHGVTPLFAKKDREKYRDLDGRDFTKVAFALDANELSQVVQTWSGDYEFFRLVEKKDPYTPGLDEVIGVKEEKVKDKNGKEVVKKKEIRLRDKVREDAIREAAWEKAQAIARQCYEKAKKTSFDKAVAWADQTIRALREKRKSKTTAEGKQQDKQKTVANDEKAVKPDAKTDSGDKSAEQSKAAAVSKKAPKSKEAAKADKGKKEKPKESDTAKDKKKVKHEIPVGESKFFTRPQYYGPQYGYSQWQTGIPGNRGKLAKAAFEVRDGEVGFAVEDKTPRACYVFEVIDRRHAKRPKDMRALPEYNRYLRQKQAALFNVWRADLLRRAQIKDWTKR